MEIDFLRPAIGDQELSITSFVREFRGPDAFVECRIVDDGGKDISRCLMVVACVDRQTNRSMDWPLDAMAVFFEP
jgi:acyl-CoA thioester hydrolase